MAELFTTYESIQAPEIISPDTQQNYQEIQALTMPDNLKEDNTTNFDFLNEDDNLDPIEFTPNNVQMQTTNTTTNDTTTQKVIDVARSFVGGKYTWGGTSPSTGFDCSGLMQYAFKQAGINLPRTAAAQGKVGQEVPSINQAKPGDLIWFGSQHSPSGQHIGMVSKIENGQVYIIDAAGKKNGILERKLPNLPIKSIRRIMSGNTITNTSSPGGNTISKAMADQIKIMESGSTNPRTLTANAQPQYGEKFATGAFGMTREFDKPGAPALKAGTTFSLERWNNIFNAFYAQRVEAWKKALAGKPNVTQDKLDALASISASGNWATPNGYFGKFVVANWNNPEAIYQKWLKTGITAAGNHKVMNGLVKRRRLEANWFMGRHSNFN